MMDVATESLSASTDVAPYVPLELREAVIRAWGFEYLGYGHKVLLQAIDDLHALPTENHRAKIVPVVQSSGTGKSKTVDKIATERILFPLCIREHVGMNFFAYPPADSAVWIHLIQAPFTTDAIGCKLYIRSFLSSLFASACLQVENLFPPDKKVTYAHMAMVFYDFFARPSLRKGFYERVVTNAKKGPLVKVWESFKRLEDNLKQRCSDWPTTVCPLLISIDEVQVLYSRKEDIGSNCSLYSQFVSVLNEGWNCNFGTITLSTKRSNPGFPSLSMDERYGERIFSPEFTELSFDLYVIANPLACDRETLTSVGSLEFTARFGRPLFYSRYLSLKDHYGSAIVCDMLRNVREKLCGCTWPPRARLVNLNALSIAVLSARLLLGLSDTTAAALRYEEALVRNHLRMLYSVQENGKIITGSSSEPLIAEASAQIMNFLVEKPCQWDEEPYMDLWGLLGNFVNEDLAAEGTIGDLIGRALSISAMDCAIHGLSGDRVCELQYQTPVTVAEYYKALLTDEVWEILRQSTPANHAQLSTKSATTTFEDAFQDAYFHFSHYGMANDCSPMRDKISWAIWLRGLAILCPFNQEVTDRMFPIYFSTLGNLSPKTVSANLEQDKIGQLITPDNAGIQSAEALSIFSPGNGLPYIAVVHCYALTENQGINIKQPSSRATEEIDEDLEAPRYQFGFRGLSAYRNITDSDRATIRRMIGHSKRTLPSVGLVSK